MQVFEVAFHKPAADIGDSPHVEPVLGKPPLYGNTNYFDLFFLTVQARVVSLLVQHSDV
jgi:hypothetical protein